MRAKTFAEHRIRQYLEAVYPGLDGHMEKMCIRDRTRAAWWTRYAWNMQGPYGTWT